MLYSGLTDQVFNAPGSWDIRKCNNLDCGTLWLDPMPADAELLKLYAGYYTHQASHPNSVGNHLRRLFDLAGHLYLHARFGYAPPRLWINKLLGLFIYLLPAWKERLAASVFYLSAQPCGSLLEVGCGSGVGLQLMRQKGWRVTGVDFDEGAVENARGNGLDVRLGDLSVQGFAAESFDAVVMRHVIEHVPSPIELFSECRRVLKKGGILVVLTPNADSLGHRRYGRSWRGLEPPRHLRVFTTKSLASMAGLAGYDSAEVFTSMQGATSLWAISAEIAKNGRHDMIKKVGLYQYFVRVIIGISLGWARIFSPGRGEIAVMVCRK